MEKLRSDASSLRLSRGLVLLFTALVAALDVGGWWFVQFVCIHVVGHATPLYLGTLLVCLYVCSVPAYVALHDLYCLLRNLEQDLVFDRRNVTLMHRVSLCCWFVAAVCLLGSFVWVSLIVVAMAPVIEG